MTPAEAVHCPPTIVPIALLRPPIWSQQNLPPDHIPTVNTCCFNRPEPITSIMSGLSTSRVSPHLPSSPPTQRVDNQPPDPRAEDSLLKRRTRMYARTCPRHTHAAFVARGRGGGGSLNDIFRWRCGQRELEEGWPPTGFIFFPVRSCFLLGDGPPSFRVCFMGPGLGVGLLNCLVSWDYFSKPVHKGMCSNTPSGCILRSDFGVLPCFCMNVDPPPPAHTCMLHPPTHMHTPGR